jgi:transposase
MATRFVSIDRDTPLQLPPNLRDWVPADHLVHFLLDAVDALDLRQVRVNTRGTGSKQYPPAMLLGLLIYSYATGIFGSRRIEQSTYDSVPGRGTDRQGRHVARYRSRRVVVRLRP